MVSRRLADEKYEHNLKYTVRTARAKLAVVQKKIAQRASRVLLHRSGKVEGRLKKRLEKWTTEGAPRYQPASHVGAILNDAEKLARERAQATARQQKRRALKMAAMAPHAVVTDAGIEQVVEDDEVEVDDVALAPPWTGQVFQKFAEENVCICSCCIETPRERIQEQTATKTNL